MRDNTELSDRLFLSYARAATWHEFSSLVMQDSDLASLPGVSDALSQLQAVGSLGGSQFRAELQRMASNGADGLVFVATASFLMAQGLQLSDSEIRRIGEDLAVWESADGGNASARAVCRALIDYVYGGRAVVLREYDEAGRFLDRALSILSPTDCGAFEDFVRHLIHYQRSELARERGDYHQASESLSRSLEIVHRWAFAVPQIHCKRQLAHLLWASGQAQQALMVHRDPEARSIAERAGLSEWLLRSHLDATKCAIDAKDLDIAREELLAANASLAICSAADRYAGYVTLYSGQVALMNGDLDHAQSSFERAVDQFEALDPADNAGALDAKISLAEFALYERDYRSFFLILEKLVEEAESKECLDARSRLLVLNAYLFITDDPPLKEAFGQALQRMHLINNPALLLKALSFLFHYAIRFLGEREQAFVFLRLRNLEDVLEKSCYDSLYRDYVSAQYEDAMEARLSRILEQDEGSLESE